MPGPKYSRIRLHHFFEKSTMATNMSSNEIWEDIILSLKQQNAAMLN